MITSKLFQYAIIWNPTEKQAKEGAKSKLVVEPSTLLAQDQEKANIMIARLIPEAHLEELDQIQIAVRPF